MKRIVGLVLVALVLCGVAALAGGPLVNLGIEPASGGAAYLGIGWTFDSWSLIAEKVEFSTWAGIWALGVLWTPDVGWASVRFGPKIALEWNNFGLFYEDLAIVLGVQRFWGIVGVFGQLEVNTSTGIVPRVGFELHFQLPSGTAT